MLYFGLYTTLGKILEIYWPTTNTLENEPLINNKTNLIPSGDIFMGVSNSMTVLYLYLECLKIILEFLNTKICTQIESPLELNPHRKMKILLESSLE